jgi:hypothetical protein
MPSLTQAIFSLLVTLLFVIVPTFGFVQEDNNVARPLPLVSASLGKNSTFIFMFSEEEKAQLWELIRSGAEAQAQELMAEILKARAIQEQEIKELLFAKRAPCKCECHVKNWVLVDYLLARGYGKYCGAGYTCATHEPGCDEVDECCRIHDECVGNMSFPEYCHSCKCNLALIDCLAPVTGHGFLPCNKEMLAKKNILEDLCLVLKYAPAYCGGCDTEEPVPPICASFFSSSSS